MCAGEPDSVLINHRRALCCGSRCRRFCRYCPVKPACCAHFLCFMHWPRWPCTAHQVHKIMQQTCRNDPPFYLSASLRSAHLCALSGSGMRARLSCALRVVIPQTLSNICRRILRLLRACPKHGHVTSGRRSARANTNWNCPSRGAPCDGKCFETALLCPSITRLLCAPGHNFRLCA